MRFERVRIAALGYDLPPEVLSSEAIEERLSPVYERIGLHTGRLELMTGIKERRFWPGEVRPSTVATAAGRRALESGGIDRSRIGCLIHASVCRDFLEPATANVVHDALGLPPTAQVFDVSNACLGVLNGMILVANMIELGQIDAGLVVAGENGKPLVDSTVEGLLADPSINRKSIKGAFASLTIGSGACAVLLAREDLAPNGHRLLGASVRNATEHHELCQGGVGTNDTGVGTNSQLAMSTDSEALLLAGISLARENFLSFSQNVLADADRVITHQVGKAHHKMLFDSLELDPESSHTTYERLGNVGSVSLPITLAMAAEEGFVTAGSKVALLGIGSGLSSIMAGVAW